MRKSGIVIASNASRFAARWATALKRSSSGLAVAAERFSGPFHPARAGIKLVSGFCASFRICLAVGRMGVAATSFDRDARQRSRINPQQARFTGTIGLDARPGSSVLQAENKKSRAIIWGRELLHVLEF